MGLNVLEIILTLQTEYYKKHNRAVSIVIMSGQHYKQLTRELLVSDLNNLHGMRIMISSSDQLILY